MSQGKQNRLNIFYENVWKHIKKIVVCLKIDLQAITVICTVATSISISKSVSHQRLTNNFSNSGEISKAIS